MDHVGPTLGFLVSTITLMRSPLLLLPVILGQFGALVDAQGTCVNQACNYVTSTASACSTNQSLKDCVCTQRFTVNLSRCLAGIICPWDGTGSPETPLCPDVYCPGSIDQSLVNLCPGVSTSGIPHPPSSGAPGQTASSVPASAPNGQSTTTRSSISTGTGTGTTPAPSSASSTPTSTAGAAAPKFFVTQDQAIARGTLVIALGILVLCY